jgi:hypothetical protein
MEKTKLLGVTAKKAVGSERMMTWRWREGAICRLECTSGLVHRKEDRAYFGGVRGCLG